jgi:hypothetical protein
MARAAESRTSSEKLRDALLWILVGILIFKVFFASLSGGNYSLRVDDLEFQVQDLQEEVDSLKTQVVYQDSYISALETKLKTQERISEWYVTIPSYYPPYTY